MFRPMYLFKNILKLVKKAMAKMVQRSINDIMIVGGSTEILNIQKVLQETMTMRMEGMKIRNMKYS